MFFSSREPAAQERIRSRERAVAEHRLKGRIRFQVQSLVEAPKAEKTAQARLQGLGKQAVVERLGSS